MDVSLLQKVYANPSWTLILGCLEKMRSHPHLECPTVVPYWVGAVWWPLLLRLCDRQKPVIIIQPKFGLFKNCLDQKMPPTRWPLLCVTLSGKCYREQKRKLKTSIVI